MGEVTNDPRDPLAGVCAPEHLAAAVRMIRPYGSIACYLPGSPPRRVLELDRRGTPTSAIRRGLAGEFHGAWVRSLDGSAVGVLPGGAEHPLWGPSDRIVRKAEPLTVSAALDWDRPGRIPALADPTRLPPGAGIAILNLLAALADDAAVAALRYRGPYPTEQLFWALAESFRFDPAVPDPLAAFLEGAEAAFLAGGLHEAPLDWAPWPHERLFLEAGVYLQLRDGVEKVCWEGRSYYRAEWQGLRRREHRVVRPAAAADGRPVFVASLVALGHPLEDHLVLDADGHVLERPAPRGVEAGPAAGAALAPAWREALAVLLPLEATPLLAPAIAAVWPGLEVVWGPVPRDLVETHGERVRLSVTLARLYLTERAALAGPPRRALAQALVREVLGLVGPAARHAAAAWLAAQPPARQAELLDTARGADRPAAVARAASALGRLLDALVSGEALPTRAARGR